MASASWSLAVSRRRAVIIGGTVNRPHAGHPALKGTPVDKESASLSWPHGSKDAPTNQAVTIAARRPLNGTSFGTTAPAWSSFSRGLPQTHSLGRRGSVTRSGS